LSSPSVPSAPGAKALAAKAVCAAIACGLVFIGLKVFEYVPLAAGRAIGPVPLGCN
jgi:hypothetical protein